MVESFPLVVSFSLKSALRSVEPLHRPAQHFELLPHMGLVLRALDFGFRVSDFGLRVTGFGFRGSESRAPGFGFRNPDFGIWNSDFGFRIFSPKQVCFPRASPAAATRSKFRVLGFRCQYSGFGRRDLGSGFELLDPWCWNWCSASEAGSYLRLTDFCRLESKTEEMMKG